MIETGRLTLSPWTEAERAPLAAMCADPRVTRDPSRDFLFEADDPAVVFVAPRSRYAEAAGGGT